MRTLKAAIAVVMIVAYTALIIYHQVFLRQNTQDMSAHAGWYATGPLAGRHASSLYATYLGLSTPGNVIPKKIFVDWNDRLAKLWEAKETSSHHKLAIVKMAVLISTAYRTHDPERMSLATYLTIANDRANLMHQKTDWNKVGGMYFTDRSGHVDDRKLRLLKQISSHIDGNTLVAYAMTELLPAQEDGKFNYAYLDFLLQHGGRRFVENIPAVYDSYVSFGPYQFTSLALYDSDGTRRGASRMNQALPVNYQIPGSVSQLHGDDHFDAAYLFATNNVALLIRSLNARELQTLEKVWNTRQLDLVQFIATAHNKPAAACTAAHHWLKNHARTSYASSTTSASRIYATKTKSNFSVLR